MINTNQKLRFIINEYWKLLNIDDFYTLYKTHKLKIKKASEISETNKLSIIETFEYGIKEIEQLHTNTKQLRNDFFHSINREHIL